MFVLLLQDNCRLFIPWLVVETLMVIYDTMSLIEQCVVMVSMSYSRVLLWLLSHTAMFCYGKCHNLQYVVVSVSNSNVLL